MLDAAERLFAERGFADATIAAIAAAAGVSAPTVYAVFGSKAGLLAALLTALEDRVDRDDWARRINEEPDIARRLHLFAEWSMRLYAGGHALIRASYRASAAPAVAALHAEGNRRRRDALRALIDSPSAQSLRFGIAVDEAVDRAMVLTSPAVYLTCVEDCGWTGRRYQSWLSELLTRELLE